MKRDVKRMQRQGKNLQKLIAALNLLVSGVIMPERYCDHALKGNLKDFRACHIEPDWLLIYHIADDILVRHRFSC
jgi:mRNA interferase YafQ